MKVLFIDETHAHSIYGLLSSLFSVVLENEMTLMRNCFAGNENWISNWPPRSHSYDCFIIFQLQLASYVHVFSSIQSQVFLSFQKLRNTKLVCKQTFCKQNEDKLIFRSSWPELEKSETAIQMFALFLIHFFQFKDVHWIDYIQLLDANNDIASVGSSNARLVLCRSPNEICRDPLRCVTDLVLSWWHYYGNGLGDDYKKMESLRGHHLRVIFWIRSIFFSESMEIRQMLSSALLYENDNGSRYKESSLQDFEYKWAKSWVMMSWVLRITQFYNSDRKTWCVEWIEWQRET